GRPILRCETPDVTTEMQIGGADLRDNIVFFPMELRDAAGTTGASVHQIILGLLRENGEWKLLSLGLLRLDLPSLEVEWDAAEVEQTEKSALETLNKVAGAVEAYRNKYAHLPESLARLGPPLHGAANGEAAGLLDSDLANGMKNGYTVRYVIVGASTLGAPAKYELAATPLQYGRTGRCPSSSFTAASGSIFITRSITTPNCERPPPSRTRAPGPPVQLRTPRRMRNPLLLPRNSTSGMVPSRTTSRTTPLRICSFPPSS